jgi:hypothetical protein
VRQTLERRIELWLADPDSSVVYAEEVAGRWAVRMTQLARDATTVWFDIGERSLRFEAYVLPAIGDAARIHEYALRQNQRAWRAFFAVDEEGALLLRGRIAEDRLDLDELDRALGEVYDSIEVVFPVLVAMVTKREKSG